VGRGFGVAAGLDPEVAGPLAARCEELGYDSMWSNDHPGAKGLETLAVFGKGCERLELGVGVIALDRTPPSQIAADLHHFHLDPSRVWVGVGAGFSKKPLTTMREELSTIRAALPDVRIVLAAMGPKMCELAGASYDGAFFNWMTPEYAAKAKQWVAAGAESAGRERPPIFGYVRTAVGPDAAERLAKEEGFYRELHPGYQRHFERLGEPEGTVGIGAPNAAAAQDALTAYADVIDTVVVRGLASGSLAAMSSVAEAAAP
jgi:alkanesulfonate monooxygenase SsuD/methylene tetrahydromethanopterin reductase-like flavin-dependent oxidoreductase (luciferase family)